MEIRNLLRPRPPVLVSVALAVAIGCSSEKRRSEIECGNYIVSIGFAARLWAHDHDERLPPDLLTMSNELNSPKILHCPGDKTRQRVRTWAEFTDANSSYEVVTPGAGDGDTNAVYLRCRVHGHLGYADATVFDGKQRRTKRLF